MTLSTEQPAFVDDLPAYERMLQVKSDEFENAPPQDILKWAIETYQPKLAMACSFGMQSVIMLDMLHQMDLLSHVDVFYLDTGVLFEETHQTRMKVSEKYHFSPIRVATEISLEQQAELHGEKLWETNPDECCNLRKVLPMQRFLVGKHAWITGMRRQHSDGRGKLPLVQWDHKNNLVKINPLAAFDEATLWGYMKAYEVPYNPLYDQGYPSIGCAPCTSKVKPGDDPRSGRWAGKGKVECGIHLDSNSIQSLDSSGL